MLERHSGILIYRNVHLMSFKVAILDSHVVARHGNGIQEFRIAFIFEYINFQVDIMRFYFYMVCFGELTYVCTETYIIRIISA